LIILRNLRDYMTDGQIWNCVSLELNIDSITQRLDFSYSLEIMEGLFLKAYQHGYNARIEVMDRRKVSLREVTELFQALAGGVAAKEALRKVDALEARVAQNETDTRLALNIARKAWDKRIERDRSMKEVQEVPGPSLFKTGTEFKRERAGEPPQ